MKYTMEDKQSHGEATVDGITLVVGGEPQELDDDQIKRLKDAGVKVKQYEEQSTEEPPAPGGRGRSDQ
jgi:hypothetical protein